ncbi:PucR family transcriptional regulator [Thermomonospora amylolytica]|uniref:PucR family transcriptional regulator n=1 Tax=Thermomonospora amylolytica TaxID=1411117 RepID=UPI000E6D59E7|nr:PucR family transcriptional regulator [Thermomonospora amylolytica]
MQDELDIDRTTRAIAEEAAAVMASSLRTAGPAYPWNELLPGLVARILELLPTTCEPTEADRRRLVAAARRCARDWVPLKEVELGCQILLACVFGHLWRTAGPRCCAELLRLSGRTAAVLSAVLGTVRRAYVEELGRVSAHRVEGLVISALLEGDDAAVLSGEAGIAFPEPGVVLCITCAGEPQRREPVFDEVPHEIRKRLGEGALCAPSPDGTRLIVVLPASSTDAPEAAPDARLSAAELVESCGAEYGRDFVAGMAYASGIGDAARAVREALWVADLLARGARGGRTGQVGFLLDLVPEAVVAERDDLRERLMTRLAAVRARRQLWTTLRALYDCDLDRGRTARWLGIHRSTLDYRLNSVHRLIGISPTSVRGIVLLSAGLAADSLGS